MQEFKDKAGLLVEFLYALLAKHGDSIIQHYDVSLIDQSKRLGWQMCIFLLKKCSVLLTRGIERSSSSVIIVKMRHFKLVGCEITLDDTGSGK